MPRPERVDEQHGVVHLATGLSPSRTIAGIPPVNGPEGGWPPRPLGSGAMRIIAVEERPGLPTAERRKSLLQRAVNDDRVIEALGTRSDYISMHIVPPKKAMTGTADHLTRLLFFNHATGITVEVTMRGNTVEHIRKRAGYQPAENPEEVERAIAVARSHPSFAAKVAGLVGKAILAQHDPELHPLATRRVMYVAFYREGHENPLCAARVDLTDTRVFDVREFHGGHE